MGRDGGGWVGLLGWWGGGGMLLPSITLELVAVLGSNATRTLPELAFLQCRASDYRDKQEVGDCNGGKKRSAGSFSFFLSPASYTQLVQLMEKERKRRGVTSFTDGF